MAFTEPRVGCGAAIIVEGRILLLFRRTEPEAGCWGLPGGKVDLFEPAASARGRGATRPVLPCDATQRTAETGHTARHLRHHTLPADQANAIQPWLPFLSKAAMNHHTTRAGVPPSPIHCKRRSL